MCTVQEAKHKCRTKRVLLLVVSRFPGVESVRATRIGAHFAGFRLAIRTGVCGWAYATLCELNHPILITIISH
eukprot:SAG31_NODE_4677_length_3040_cov_3.849031_6_plen_73_part_00